MAELVFVEGVSGVGKSTMVHSLTEQLCADGHSVKSYVEFDYTNPIDFYCTAYVPLAEYKRLCSKYAADKESIHRYTIHAGDINMIRYYNEDTPLFSEPLLSKLKKMEFCYNPTQLVPIEKYTDTYKTIWQNFISSIDYTIDYYLFDGSLLHHPINDMMRNYHASTEQIISHVRTIVETLTETTWRVCYLKVDDIAEQLDRAHRNRGQHVPSKEEISFWQARYDHDTDVLKYVIQHYQMYNVTNNRWESALQEMLQSMKNNSNIAR